MQHLPPSYRNNPYRDQLLKLQVSGKPVELSWRWLSGGRFEFLLAGQTYLVDLLAAESGQVRYALDGIQRTFTVTEVGERFFVHSALGACTIEKLPRYPEYEVAADAGSANSPMPGQVLKLLVETGQQVAKGEALLILEAMKMEHTLRAALDGVVEAIMVKPGEVVSPGQVLIHVKAP
jgi:biotin carboxyl carrier protein